MGGYDKQCKGHMTNGDAHNSGHPVVNMLAG